MQEANSATEAGVVDFVKMEHMKADTEAHDDTLHMRIAADHTPSHAISVEVAEALELPGMPPEDFGHNCRVKTVVRWWSSDMQLDCKAGTYFEGR